MKRIGFGQVEPNHLSAQRTAQIYAQLPAAADIDVLENGQFVKYDYASGEVNFTGKGEWMMVFNEVKLYDDMRETYKDFAMQKKNYVPEVTFEGLDTVTKTGSMTPRVIKTNIGDIYTTNCLAKGATSGTEEVEMGEFEVGDILSPNAKGFLEVVSDGEIQFEVVKVYTMPDMQAGLKLMRIA